MVAETSEDPVAAAAACAWMLKAAMLLLITALWHAGIVVALAPMLVQILRVANAAFAPARPRRDEKENTRRRTNKHYKRKGKRATKAQ